MFEVEIKIKVKGDLIQGRLKELGAVKKGRITQKDTYFQHPNRDFGKTDEALRVRVLEAQRAQLTYKGPKIGQIGKIREEIEADLQDVDKTVLILKALGFRAVGEVRKVREIWDYEGLEAALDRVDGLGDFLELEVIVAQGNKEDALNLAVKRLEKLGLDPKKEIRKSYLELLQEKRGGEL